MFWNHEKLRKKDLKQHLSLMNIHWEHVIRRSRETFSGGFTGDRDDVLILWYLSLENFLLIDSPSRSRATLLRDAEVFFESDVFLQLVLLPIEKKLFQSSDLILNLLWYVKKEAFPDLLLRLAFNVGELYLKDPSNIEGEHYLTARAVSFFQNEIEGRRSSREVLLMCPETELHELGLLRAAAELHKNKVSFSYIGPNFPLASIKKAEVKTVVMSLSSAFRYDEVFAHHLISLVPCVRFVIGGKGSSDLRKSLKDLPGGESALLDERIVITDSFQTMVDLLSSEV